jgi:hypothetical protein
MRKINNRPRAVAIAIACMAMTIGCDNHWPPPDEGVWEVMESGTTEHLRDAFGFSTNDVFAVGDNGTILHYNGTDWSQMNIATTVNLNGVWGFAHDDVFVSGNEGTMLHYDGVGWTALDVGTTDPIGAVTGVLGDRVLAIVGTMGRVLMGFEVTPGQYQWQTYDSNANVPLNAIAAFSDEYSPASVAVVGDDGVAYLFEGPNDWYEMNTGTSVDLRGVYGDGPNNLIAVGGETVIAYTGDVVDSIATWHPLVSPPGNPLNAIVARSYNDVFMLGDEARLLTYDRVDFEDIVATPVFDLNGAWANESHVYAVGESGAIVRYSQPSDRQWCPDNVVVEVGDGPYPEITWSPPCAIAQIIVDSDAYGVQWYVTADGNLIEPDVSFGTTPDNAKSMGPEGWKLESGELYRIRLIKRDADGELVVGYHNFVHEDAAAIPATRPATSPTGYLKGWHYMEVEEIIEAPPGAPTDCAFRGLTVDHEGYTNNLADPLFRQEQLDVRPARIFYELRDPDTGLIVLRVINDALVADLYGTDATVFWGRSGE